MTSKGSNIRKTLFELFATNLSYHDPHYQGVFVCPLCLQEFHRDALDKDELSIEHIIPRKAGGQMVTLTCKACNNTAGATVDSHLVNRLRTEDQLASGSRSLPHSVIHTERGKFTADVHISDDQVLIQASRRLSKPELYYRAISDIEKGDATISINSRLGFGLTQSSVAILRSAYLFMFSVFGYGYIRFDLLDSVREQIHNPDQRSSVLNGVINSSPGPEATTLSVLCTPRELRSFFINFDISSDSVKRYVAVLLPGLESGGGRIYERALSHAALRANLRHVPIPSDQSLLTDLQRKDEALKIWRLACLDSG